MMFSKYLGFTLVFSFSFLSPPCAVSQLALPSATVNQDVQTGLQSLKQIYPNAKISQSATTGLPTAITGLGVINPKRLDLLGSNVNEAVNKFVNDASLKSLFPSVVSTSNSTLVQIESHANPLSPGKTIVTLRQMVGNIPAFGGEVRLEVSKGQAVPSAPPAAGSPNMSTMFAVSDVKANVLTLSDDVSTQTSIGSPEVTQSASKAYSSILTSTPEVKSVEVSLFGSDPKPSTPQLVMFDPSTLGEQASGLRPTWIVNLGSYVFFFDANNGTLIHRYRNLHKLASFQVMDYAQSIDAPTLVQDETGPIPAGASVAAESAKAIKNAKAARAFFQLLAIDLLPSSCNCDPFLLTPSKINLNIRYSGTNTSYWMPGLNEAFFADGFANAPDVVAHELTHGVTTFMSCITNDYDSGAIAEFYSDFFAAMLRQQDALNPWTIGDTLPQFATPNSPLRNMGDPHQPGFNAVLAYADDNRGQPEILSEHVSPASGICSGDLDNHCAHINSGILDKASYLMVVGGNFGGISITGIGFDKSARIMIRSLQVLTEVPTFSQVAQNIESACSDEQAAPNNTMTAVDCANVQRAFQAVGIE